MWFWMSKILRKRIKIRGKRGRISIYLERDVIRVGLKGMGYSNLDPFTEFERS